MRLRAIARGKGCIALSPRKDSVSTAIGDDAHLWLILLLGPLEFELNAIALLPSFVLPDI